MYGLKDFGEEHTVSNSLCKWFDSSWLGLNSLSNSLNDFGQDLIVCANSLMVYGGVPIFLYWRGLGLIRFRI